MTWREETIGPCRLILADCMTVLPTLSGVDAVVTDPPYGIGFAHGGNDSTGIGGGRYATKFAGKAIIGDEKPFDPSHLLGFPLVVLWGANHFADALPRSSRWFVWDKRAASEHSNDFADCEIAWCSESGVARVFRHHWDGMMRASERGVPRVHPTQKPVKLMVWCMDQCELFGDELVCDPYMGSGTTGVAVIQRGGRFIGIEKDEEHFENACSRIRRAWQDKQSEIKWDEPPKLKQRELLEVTP